MEANFTVTIDAPANEMMLRPLCALVRELAKSLPRAETDPHLVDDLELIFNEAFVNIYKHAYSGKADGRAQVEITFGPDHVHLTFEDRGAGFDPDVDPPKALSSSTAWGRGVLIMRGLTDEFRYHQTQDGANVLRLVKRLG
jgi:anti-sigma regulatory factor (Ser/Thr protein kinase)